MFGHTLRHVETEVAALKRQGAVERLDVVDHHVRTGERNAACLQIKRVDIKIAVRDRQRQILEAVRLIARDRDGFGLRIRSGFFVGLSRCTFAIASILGIRGGKLNLDALVLNGERKRPDRKVTTVNRGLYCRGKTCKNSSETVLTL